MTRSVEIAHDMDEAKYKFADEFLSRRIGEVLVRCYSGHGWEVEVSNKQGVCKIYNKHVSRWYGYMLKIADINWESFDRQIMRVGGDMLERTSLRRDKFVEDDVLGLVRDKRGHAKVFLDK